MTLSEIVDVVTKFTRIEDDLADIERKARELQEAFYGSDNDEFYKLARELVDLILGKE